MFERLRQYFKDHTQDDPWFQAQPPNERPEPSGAEEPEPDLNADERITRSVARFRAEKREARLQAAQAQKESLARDKEKIDQAERFVSDTGVGDSLIGLFETLKLWYHWQSRPDWDLMKYLPELTIDGLYHFDDGGSPVEEYTAATRGIQLEFEYCGHHFLLDLTWHNNAAYDNEYFGILKLSEHGETLIGIDVRKDLENEFPSWHYGSIKSLSIGEWVEVVIELSERIGTITEDDSAKSIANDISDLAKNLPDIH